jgi:hypothetical protein
MTSTIEIARQIADQCTRRTPPTWTHEFAMTRIMLMVESARADEREACQALQQHEDVLAPVGNSAWGEAYQDGWAEGTAVYRAAIRARGNA